MMLERRVQARSEDVGGENATGKNEQPLDGKFIAWPCNVTNFIAKN